ncbi:DUF1223 domain-containing protein [Roseococcus sp. SDR]|uniref:DUF1223 domain-containing protein n=1 Tax=Roseococcus sp. SDR TaxID=2835532 RepID=UPI001BCE3FE0|nr:DUF1223 domain-containing protein [Roseococcus sp. SDR]MBS7791911.1 DUF1223 domain-containing protein [Roseococcus sp. SDR]MBV1847225.1 DUF1223 domain-containing protein [Roseococcus sp. SDR]
MQRRLLLAGLPAAAIWRSRAARARPHPVVAELFTSQSCNSCPPADALLLELIRDQPDVLALSFHVTYWDRLGWKDRFSLRAATERQRRYAAQLREGRYPGQVYTPQMVIQGQRDAVGSDRAAVLAELRAAPAAAGVALVLEAHASEAVVEIGPGGATAWLIGFDARHETEIRAGENGGRRLAYGHVVRSLTSLPLQLGARPRQAVPRGAGERVAVLVQGADGAILAAASA